MRLEDLDIQTKVGQLFTFSAFGQQLGEQTRRLITELKPGGLFLPTGALHRPEQVHRLTTDMQTASLGEGSGIPLFISADFVAGAGCKLKQGGATHFPKNRAIGAAGDESLAYESGRITAEESLAMGVNFNYSPVVDINNNPLNPVIGTHSFGEDRERVSRLGNAIIRGYQNHGLIATAKHFPGHGDTQVDSHEDLPVLRFGRERLENFELMPFKRAIDCGVEAVMVGHIAVPSLDPSMKPASLSYEITTKLLREQLCFDGLIVTDGLTMKGVANQYSMEDACVLAVLAGADILLATMPSFETSLSVFQAVVKAVENGTIPMERLNKSVARILRTKEKFGLTATAFQAGNLEPSKLLTLNARAVNDALAQKAVTPVRGVVQGCVGAKRDEAWILIHDRNTRFFADTLAEEIAVTQLETEMYEGVLDLLKEQADDGNIIVAVSHNKPMNPEFLAALDERLELRKHAVWVHFGSEYDVAGRNHPALLLYDHAPSLQTAAAQYILHSKV